LAREVDPVIQLRLSRRRRDKKRKLSKLIYGVDILGMEKALAKIGGVAKKAIKKAELLETIEELRIAYLGRKGALTAILRSLKDLPQEERKKWGQEANRLREEIEGLLSIKQKELEKVTFESVLKKERLDMTRPGESREKGHLHPITKITGEITGIFSLLGFEVIEGPEVESEYYNFDALNIPPLHPAREMHDTFWIKQSETNKKDPRRHLLLRTHISTLQVRFMEKNNPPFRWIAPGRVYRYEASDASHDIQFNYLEGLMVDRKVSVANLKAIIQEFFSRLFTNNIEIRLRPSYFPFVEPGFEVDISCINCNSKGCSVCKKSGWLELAGAGMVHPNVFKAAGYNPKDWHGFAFGMGIDRLAMMKYKIPDIRLFHSGDLKFLRQF